MDQRSTGGALSGDSRTEKIPFGPGDWGCGFDGRNADPASWLVLPVSIPRLEQSCAIEGEADPVVVQRNRLNQSGDRRVAVVLTGSLSARLAPLSIAAAMVCAGNSSAKRVRDGALRASYENEGKPLPATILLTERRQSWTSDGFRTSWRKACAKAGIAGLTFHDLRGTVVTRLAIAGASVPQIATITGHSLKDVETILDAHYLNRNSGIAETAISKLERRGKL